MRASFFARFHVAFRIALLLIMLTLVRASAQTGTFVRLPADLYILTNTGVVERYALGETAPQPLTPPDTYVIDFGIDIVGERLAYRADDGLWVTLIPPPDAPPAEPLPGVMIEGESASLPNYRGRGETIAWSPGGDLLVYTTLTGARAYIDGADGTRFQDLSESPFLSLTWSPGGTYLAAEGESNIWWIYRRDEESDGTSLALTSIIPSSIGTAWVSDSEIVFAPADGGLKLMNLAAANAQTTLLDERLEYRLPFLTADDRLVFFTRDPADPNTPEGYGVLRRLARGATTVETIGEPVPLTGVRWIPGGQYIFAFQGGVLGMSDPRTGIGTPFTVNNAVAYAWGPLALDVPPLLIAPTATPIPSPTPMRAPETTAEITSEPLETVTAPLLDTEPESVTGLVLSAEGFFRADDPALGDQIWALPANGQSAYRFTGASGAIREWAASRDGRIVTYLIDDQLWVQRFEVRQPFIVAEIASFAPINPVISPDGTRIAYSDESIENGGIYLIMLDGRPQTLLLPNITPDSPPDPFGQRPTEADVRTYRRPQWSPDGTRLLLDVFRADGIVSGIIDVDARLNVVEGETPPAVIETPLTPGDTRPLTARWTADGDLLTYADAGSPIDFDPGFYRFDSNAPATSPVQRFPIPRETLVRDFVAIDNDRVRALLESSNASAAGILSIVDTEGLSVNAIAQIDLAAEGLTRVGAVRFSPDARFLALIAASGSTPTSAEATGTLRLYDLLQGGIFTIDAAEDARGFRWGG